jgi:hypothetical protein
MRGRWVVVHWTSSRGRSTRKAVYSYSRTKCSTSGVVLNRSKIGCGELSSWQVKLRSSKTCKFSIARGDPTSTSFKRNDIRLAIAIKERFGQKTIGLIQHFEMRNRSVESGIGTGWRSSHAYLGCCVTKVSRLAALFPARTSKRRSSGPSYHQSGPGWTGEFQGLRCAH